jgi:Ca-activated chloride channel family protein
VSWVLRDPVWLSVFLVSLPMGLLAWRWFVSMSRVRRGTAVLLRGVLLALLSLVLAGLAWSSRVDRLAVIGVIDVSQSVQRFAQVGGQAGTDNPSAAIDQTIDQAARRFFASALAQRETDDLLGLVVFDGEAVAVALPTTTDPTERELLGPGGEGTDIASALRLAAAMVPPGATGRLVLISDGNETGRGTGGDAATAAAEIASRGSRAGVGGGVSVDVVPLGYRVGREVAIESVEAPPISGAESTVGLRVVLRSTAAASGTISILLNGDPVDANGPADGFARRVALSPGRTVVEVPITLGVGRVHRFEAVFEPDTDAGGELSDTSLTNNRGESFTVTPGRGRVLLASGAAGGGAVLAQSLRSVGIGVDVVGPAGLPGSMLELQGYDAVLLENVPVEGVDDARQELLAEWVRRFGGGLVMIGGPDSFGGGGWRGSTIEGLLPVNLDLPVREVKPEAAVVFVIDKSGSMGAGVLGSKRSQQEIANEATVLAIRMLAEYDLVGVIAFSDREREVVRLGPNEDAERTASAVRSISPGGATNLPPALRLAVDRLSAIEAKDRQIVVLTDGQSENSEQLLPIAEGLTGTGIRLTTIAIGDDADVDRLRTMAAAGDGAFYRVTRPEALPAVLIKAVRVERSPMVREEPFTPNVADPNSPMIAGFGSLPVLGGLSLTSVRDEPTVTTSVVTGLGEPVLADWPVELGRVVAFTSDADEWASGWAATPVYTRFWAQLVRTVSRATDTGGGELSVEAQGRVLRLTYRAQSKKGVPLDRLHATARVYGPDGSKLDADLVQSGPGEYAAEILVPNPGAWIAVASAQSEGQPLAPAFGGVTVSAGGELSALTSNIGLLKTIADTTGGRVLGLDDAAEVFDRSSVSPRLAVQNVWPIVLAWAIVVFLLDVGTRKVAWDRFVSKDFGEGLAARARHAVKDRGGSAQAAVAGLKTSQDAPESLAARLKKSSGVSATERMAADTDREVRRARVTAHRDKVEQQRADKKTSGEGTASGPPSPTAQPKSDEPTAPEESGLLAAKRRARERFESDEG